MRHPYVPRACGHAVPACVAAPCRLRGKRLISVDVGALVAGSSFRGEFEARLHALVREASAPDVLLFIDEVHMLGE